LIALDLYKYVIIAAAVMSWLIAFNVGPILRNDVCRLDLGTRCVALTEPAAVSHPPLVSPAPAASTFRRSCCSS